MDPRLHIDHSAPYDLIDRHRLGRIRFAIVEVNVRSALSWKDFEIRFDIMVRVLHAVLFYHLQKSVRVELF